MSVSTRGRPAEDEKKNGIRTTFGLRSRLRFPRSWREVRALGWKFVAAFVLFYLIRDTVLYILIPYLIYSGLIGN